MQRTDFIGLRTKPDLARAVREAAAAEGVTVSAWVSRRLRNNLRRTGRLAPAQHPEQPTTQEA